MNPPRSLLLILAFTLTATLAHATDAEETRLRGFAEHQKRLGRFEEAREGAKQAYMEEEEQWLNEKDRERAAYIRNKPKSVPVMDETSPQYKAWERERKAEEMAADQARSEYSAKMHKQEKLDREAKGLPTLAQELGLDEERPRFDFAKRNFGTKSASSGSASGRGSYSPSGNSSFPPPPTFDDFSDGYVPAPNIQPEDFGDVPPPPPPPMAPDFDGNFSNGSEFIPPPPPPPGGFDGGDF
ncbi:hypothetical protein ACLVWU_10930 [Bdellovibrio sp. HCB290]|uniref:hypothetical protein n=1 Tax=Bdellovibrio sp. HCB290 TaxID=3394356 RepID=UPI0039B6DA44